MLANTKLKISFSDPLGLFLAAVIIKTENEYEKYWIQKVDKRNGKIANYPL